MVMADIEQQLKQAALDLHKQWVMALKNRSELTMQQFQQQKIDLITIALLYGQMMMQDTNCLTASGHQNNGQELTILNGVSCEK